MTCTDKVNAILAAMGVDINEPWIIGLVDSFCKVQSMVEDDIALLISQQIRWVSILNILKKIYNLDNNDIEDLKKILFKYGHGKEFNDKLRFINVLKSKKPTINGDLEGQAADKEERARIRDNAISEVEQKSKKALELKKIAETIEYKIPFDVISELEFGYIYGAITLPEALDFLKEYSSGLHYTSNKKAISPSILPKFG